MFDKSSFVSRVLEVGGLSAELKETLGAKARNDALKYHSKNDYVFGKLLQEQLSRQGKPKPVNHLTKENQLKIQLPTVSWLHFHIIVKNSLVGYIQL